MSTNTNDINAVIEPPERIWMGHEIMNMLMHGVESRPIIPFIASEKLNGLRCVYVPGQGFYSRSGRKWKPAVLKHIVMPETHHIIDGELWTEGMNLQEINNAIAVTRDAAGPRAEEIYFNAFDIIVPYVNTFNRNRILKATFTDARAKMARYHQHYGFADWREFDKFVNGISAKGGEGVMCKNDQSFYTSGRSGFLVKVKLWKNVELVIVDFIEGEGKCLNMVGAMKFLWNNQLFEVGTFQFDYELREELWANRKDYIGKATAKLRYLTLSSDGVPQTASIEAVELL